MIGINLAHAKNNVAVTTPRDESNCDIDTAWLLGLSRGAVMAT